MSAPAKAPDAFRTIGEVATWLGVSTHVLRFWESKFPQVKPLKRAGGRRYYRPADMELLGGIRQLLHEDGLTIKGAQKVLREQGVRAVAARSPALEGAAERSEGRQPDLFADVHAPERMRSVAATAMPRSEQEAMSETWAPGSAVAAPEVTPQAPDQAASPLMSATGGERSAPVPLIEALARLDRAQVPRQTIVTILGSARRLRDHLAARP